MQCLGNRLAETKDVRSKDVNSSRMCYVCNLLLILMRFSNQYRLKDLQFKSMKAWEKSLKCQA